MLVVRRLVLDRFNCLNIGGLYFGVYDKKICQNKHLKKHLAVCIFMKTFSYLKCNTSLLVVFILALVTRRPKYSQTCIKRSHLRQRESGLIRQVTS